MHSQTFCGYHRKVFEAGNSLGCPVQSDAVLWVVPPWSREQTVAVLSPTPASAHKWVFCSYTVPSLTHVHKYLITKYPHTCVISWCRNSIECADSSWFCLLFSSWRTFVTNTVYNLALFSVCQKRLTSLRRSCSRSWYLTSLRRRNLRTS